MIATTKFKEPITILSNTVDLGVEFINLEPYRPELKSLVERFFGLVQESFKKELINKGVVLINFFHKIS